MVRRVDHDMGRSGALNGDGGPDDLHGSRTHRVRLRIKGVAPFRQHPRQAWTDTSLPAAAYGGALGILRRTAPVKVAARPVWKPSSPRVTLHLRGQHFRQTSSPNKSAHVPGRPGRLNGSSPGWQEALMGETLPHHHWSM
eukprot:4635699-Alexandrium_andersonii.AAC.1